MASFQSGFLGLLLSSACRECAVSVSLPRSDSKKYEAVLSRKVFVLAAQRLGFRYCEIGWEIGKSKGAVSKLYHKAVVMAFDKAFNKQITNTINRASRWYSEIRTST